MVKYLRYLSPIHLPVFLGFSHAMVFFSHVQVMLSPGQGSVYELADVNI